MKTDALTEQDLRTLCQQAGERAASWSMGADADRMSAAVRAPPRRKRLRMTVLVGGLSLPTLMVLATQFGTEPSIHAPAAVPSPAAAPLLPSPPLAARHAEPVRWEGSELVVGFDQLPPQQAAALLASATQSTVTGLHLLDARSSVTLHGRFSKVRAAWQQLLQQHNTAASIACSASRCQVWIADGGTAPATTTTPLDRPRRGAPQGPAGAVPNESTSQPDGSC